jgi:hydroxyacylglutathione hydrolase
LYFEQFYLSCLAHASYMLGSEGVAAVVEDAARVEESRVRLARIGIENVAGYLDGGVLAWDRAGMPTEEVPQISALQLHEQLRDEPEGVQVVDVRRPMEWRGGHLERAFLKPLDKLATLLADLNPAKPLAAYCQSGYRSSIGTSLLATAGFKQTMNVVGGLEAWKAQKFPQVSEDGTAQARG